MLITGLAAFLSSFYAFYSIAEREQVGWAVVCEGLWASLILTLDRFLVSSVRAVRREDGSYRVQFWNIIPRLVLSMAIGLVIGIPVELYVFRHEISERLEFEHHDNIKRQIFEAKADRERECNSLFEPSLLSLKEKVTQWEALIKKTNENKDGSGEGCGIRCNGYTKIRDAQAKILAAEQEKLRLCIVSPKAPELSDDPISTENSRYKEVLERREQKKVNSPSLLTQYQKLAALRKNFPEVNHAAYFIPLLFILFEVSPVLAKLLAGVSKYDILADEELEESRSSANGSAVTRATALKSHKILCEANLAKLEKEREAAFELIAQVLAAYKKRFVQRGVDLLAANSEKLSDPELEGSFDKALRELYVRVARILSGAHVNIVHNFTSRTSSFSNPSELRSSPTVEEQSHYPHKTDSAPPEPKVSTVAPISAPQNSSPTSQPSPYSHTEVFAKKVLEATAVKMPEFFTYVFQSTLGPALAFGGVMFGGLRIGVDNISSLFVGALVGILVIRVITRNRGSRMAAAI